MFLKKIFIIILFCMGLFNIYSVQRSLSEEEKIRLLRDREITINLRGYTAESDKVNYDFVLGGYYHGTHIDASGDGGLPSSYKYEFSNGYTKEPEVFKINGKTPKYMSDVLVRELGDFNYGSRVIKSIEETRDKKVREKPNDNSNDTRFNHLPIYKQSLIGLAKTEWVFDKVFNLERLKFDNSGDQIYSRGEIGENKNNYEKLLLCFGPFQSLLSYDYVLKRLQDSDIQKILPKNYQFFNL